MKRTLLLAALFCMCSMFALGQKINRNILCCTLGETTEAQFADCVKENNYSLQTEYESNGSKFYRIVNITFANKDYSEGLFCFYKGKLLFINFFTEDNYHFNGLKDALTKKYKAYLKKETIENSVSFDDGTTMIWLDGFSDSMALKYVDKKLSEQIKSDASNEL